MGKLARYKYWGIEATAADPADVSPKELVLEKPSLLARIKRFFRGKGGR